MRLKKKSGYHHGKPRRALLDVSGDVIEKHGVDAFNLRELAFAPESLPARRIIISLIVKRCSHRLRRKGLATSKQP